MTGEGDQSGTGQDSSPRSSSCDDVDEGVWRYARAERASVIVDAADYFLLMQEAMLKAKQRVFLIGWDFDTRIHLTHGRRWWQRPYISEYPSRLGGFIGWLVRHRPALDVRILKWTVSIFQFALRGSMLFDVIRWARHKRITFKFDKAHPLGCSHHQKIAVLDDWLAVCGGIDMTDKRWDTREHAENDSRRRGVGGRQYSPWHDATMMMQGEVAAALSELGRGRWERAGGSDLPHISPSRDSLWPENLPVQFANVETIATARARGRLRRFICVTSEKRSASFTRKVSISPRVRSARQSSNACKSPTRPRSSSYIPRTPMAGWNSRRWTMPGQSLCE